MATSLMSVKLNIHVPQVILSVFGDPLTFSPVSPSGRNLHLYATNIINGQMDILHIHTPQRMSPFHFGHSTCSTPADGKTNCQRCLQDISDYK